jgi:hypothetical protein
MVSERVRPSTKRRFEAAFLVHFRRKLRVDKNKAVAIFDLAMEFAFPQIGKTA